MKLTVYGLNHCQPEDRMLFDGVITRLLQYNHLDTAELHVNARREDDGWLEYLLLLTFVDGGKLTVGCIQRGMYRSIEFHT